MTYKYSWCMYGGYDHRPDLDTSTKNFTSEYWDCGNRGNCPFEFTLCDRVKIIVNGVAVFLTKKEVNVVILIASGCTDIQSADKAGIELNTLLTHKKNIYSKLDSQPWLKSPELMKIVGACKECEPNVNGLLAM